MIAASDTAGRPSLDRMFALDMALSIRPVRLDDLPRVRSDFAEGHKGAPGAERMPWRYYKQWVVPDLHAALEHAETELLGAYGDRMLGAVPAPVLVGWLAFARGPSVDTVHWVHTPHWFPVRAESCTGCVAPELEPGAFVRYDQRNYHRGACALARENRTPLRRRGIMTALLDAAALQERLVYTFRSARREEHRPLDYRLVAWLRARGHRGIEHVPWREWSR